MMIDLIIGLVVGAFLGILKLYVSYNSEEEKQKREFCDKYGKPWTRKKKKSLWWHMWHDGSNGPVGYAN